jgi:site-specific DNA-adenine methylase
MKYVEEKIRPARKKHGGKSYLARRIVGVLRPKQIFVEPFAAAASVMLNRDAASIRDAFEIYNDLDWLDANLYACLRDSGFEIIARLTEIPYDEPHFETAKLHADTIDALIRAGDKPKEWSVEAALSTIIRSRFSRGGLGVSFAWSERKRGGLPGDLNAWKTWRENDLPRTVSRVANWTIYSGRASALIRDYRGVDVASLYLDPPYVPNTRTHKTSYGPFEMPALRSEVAASLRGLVDTHEDLLESIVDATADVAISGYDSELYRRILTAPRWRRIELELPNNAGQGKSKKRRTEVLWFNFEPDQLPE